MNTARRVAAIATRLRPYPHALRRGISAIVAALRLRWQSLMIEVRARWVVFASLQDAAVRVAALEQQVAAAQQRLAAHQERERLLARSIHDGEAAAAELAGSATAYAEETMLRTRATTDAIVGSAQEAAAATLRNAQESAAATLQEARAAADATLQAARTWVDATLQTARATAQRDLEAMEQEASARIEPFMEAADRFAAGIRAMAAEAEGRIQTAETDLFAKIAQFETERDEYSGGLASLIERHAETLERVAHLQADVHDRLVPALNRLTAGLKGPDMSWLRISPSQKDRGGDKGAAPDQDQTRAVTATPIGRGAQRPARLSGEVVVHQINSFHQVKKIVRAFAQVGGVETVRLLTYVDGAATIGISTECRLAALDVKHLDGLPVDVVETTPTRLVVRLSRPS
jgi:hypothetical protein